MPQVGELNAQNQHVLSHPALVTSEARGDAQGEALLAQKHVSAVAGVYGHNEVLLGEVDNVALFGVQVRLGVEALDEVGAVAKGVVYVKTYAGHDRHGNHNVDGVGELNAVFGKGGADDGHGVRDDIHGAALHGAVVNAVEHRLHLFGVHPVVGGAGVLLALTADEGAVLNARHVVDGGAVVDTAGKLLVVELYKLAGLVGLLAEGLKLLLGAVDPDDFVGLGEGCHLIYPAEYGLVFCIHVFNLLVEIQISLYNILH